jgi:streptogramin lyase
MNPDVSGLKEFPLPTTESSPRVIALGADGNMWFSEHTGNRIGRITPDGTIAEFPISTPNSMPRSIALGADGNIWFGEFAGGKYRANHSRRCHRRVRGPDSRQRAARTHCRTRRKHLVSAVLADGRWHRADGGKRSTAPDTAQ